MADGPIPHLAHHMEEKENKRKNRSPGNRFPGLVHEAMI
jgi:hypothetical protein